QVCISAALAEKYRNKVLLEPWVLKPVFSKDGSVVGHEECENPLLNAYLKCSKMMKAFQIEFGLTPASRTRLKVEKKKDEEELPSRNDTVLPSEEIDLNSIDEQAVIQ